MTDVNGRQSIQPQTITCAVVGDGYVGKSSLLMSYKENKFTAINEATSAGYYNVRMMISERPYSLNLIDTSGTDAYEELRPRQYVQTDIFLVCFSVVSPSSFHNVKAKWVPEIRYCFPEKPILLVGTKVDLRECCETKKMLAEKMDSQIIMKQGERLAKKLNAVKYVECSALTQEGIKNVFDEAIAAALGIGKPKSECVVM